jgi:hypothetical protein
MPEFDKDEFKFPDETVNEDKGKPEGKEPEFEIEVEDDTPAQDRGREPMPKPLVEELEKDELDKYDEEVKNKLKQMRKVWHDERREKESALREQQEALNVAQRLLQENKRIKSILTNGEKEYVATVQNAANMELEMAKRAYREAYDAGDTDKIIEAQQALQQANYKIMQVKNFKLPPLQEEQIEVQPRQEQRQPVPRPDNKAEDWQNRNTWFGKNRGMTAYALGVHEDLKDAGVPVGSDEYYSELDKTIRRRFPEVFPRQPAPNPNESTAKTEPARTKPSTVVAPVARSTSPNKVKLKQSQLNTIKKLGITPEQYVKEFLKVEAQNG